MVGRSDPRPTEGIQYTLTCTVSGHERVMDMTVTYQWLKDSSIMQGQTDSTLTFNPLNRDDGGAYTCRATISSSLLTDDIVEDGSTTFQVTGM